MTNRDTLHFIGLLTFHLEVRLPFDIPWTGGKPGLDTLYQRVSQIFGLFAVLQNLDEPLMSPFLPKRVTYYRCSRSQQTYPLLSPPRHPVSYSTLHSSSRPLLQPPRHVQARHVHEPREQTACARYFS